MSKLRSGITMSLDGYIAGPEQSVENPLGIGGMRLHEWAFALAAWREQHGLEGGEVNPSTAFVEESLANVGAVLMGRNMFGGGRGPWGDDPWRGWWGDDPPFHVPVFVLTHHERDPLPLEGGTTFTFVTDGIESALEQARRAAGVEDVVIGGGAGVIRQYLAAGLVDELSISLAPVLLGGGERLLDGLGDSAIELEQVDAIAAPGVTHVRYRVVR
jgi:dihydrofolate reductase